MTSNFRQAIGPDVIICPHCGATDIPGASVKPTLEPEPGGRFTCTICGHNFLPVPMPKELER